jgi:hypothetical protein
MNCRGHEVPSSETFQAAACAVLSAVYEVAISRALSAEDSGHYSITAAKKIAAL